jgi:hypothetical protein
MALLSIVLRNSIASLLNRSSVYDIICLIGHDCVLLIESSIIACAEFGRSLICPK